MQRFEHGRVARRKSSDLVRLLQLHVGNRSEKSEWQQLHPSSSGRDDSTLGRELKRHGPIQGCADGGLNRNLGWVLYGGERKEGVKDDTPRFSYIQYVTRNFRG